MNVEFEHVEATKLLEVTLVCKLSWSKHIDTTEAKMGSSLFIIKYCSSFLTALTTRQVLQALVLSHLDYCSLVWSVAKKRGTLKNYNWLRTGQHGWPLKVYRELTSMTCMSISHGSKCKRD
jgi:hypothetical protein